MTGLRGDPTSWETKQVAWGASEDRGKGQGGQAWLWVYAQVVAVALCQALEDFLPAVSPCAPSPVDGA